MNDGTLTICLPTLLNVSCDFSMMQLDGRIYTPNMALADENTSVVDGLGQTELVDTSLKTALQEILDLEGKHVIELHARFVEHTDADETANEGIAFEETLGILLVESEKLTAEVGGQICTTIKTNVGLTGRHDESWTG
jgi:hypothetical protein